MRRARGLADLLAEEILLYVGHPDVAPVSLSLVASKLGLKVVESPGLRVEGRFVRTGLGPTIELNSSRPPTRMRHTAAHEIAHWCLHRPTPRTRQVVAAFRSEEELCDTLAASLLMPRRWACSKYIELSASLSGLALLGAFAAAAYASRESAAIRIRDLFPWERVLLRWERREEEWRFAGESGVFPWERGRIVPSASINFAFDRARALPGVVQSTELECVRTGALMPAEFMVESSYAYALVELAPQIRSQPAVPERFLDELFGVTA